MSALNARTKSVFHIRILVITMMTVVMAVMSQPLMGLCVVSEYSAFSSVPQWGTLWLSGKLFL